jgi:hypothetical protein
MRYLLLFLAVALGAAAAGDASRENAIPGITVIRVDTREPAPPWAVIERHVIETMNRAGEAFVKVYTRPDGSLIWKERYEGGMNSSDDAYEAFRGLSLLYILGGARQLDRMHRHVWDGITRQYTRYGQIYREFDSNWDWMHHGEGYTSFYTFGLADPRDEKFRERAKKFAAMYIGEDPESPNYDPKLKLIRASMTGSRGPKFTWTTRDWIPTNANLVYYHLPYDDIPGVTSSTGWINDDQFKRIVDVMSRRMARGDVPINLTVTPLIANAFLYTGDDKYKQWITGYVGAWEERTKQNNGITPDNVGLSGKIGEYMGGNWWGGYYGWKWVRGGLDVVRAEVTAAKVAMLLTGNSRWLDLPRSQLAVLRSHTKMDSGRPMVAMRYDNKHGWHSYQPEPVGPYIDLWYMSQDETDWRNIERLARGRPSRRGGGADFGWISFLQGNNPDFPEQAFAGDLEFIAGKLKRILNEHGDPETWVDSHWSSLDPLPMDNLVRLTIGGLPVDLRGEMLHSRLRYFDADRHEPGLPEDVAALVTRFDANSTEVRLVNISLFEPHRVIVQGGAYGEHQITEVTWKAATGAGEERASVRRSFFQVDLPPGTGTTLHIRMTRFANKPSFDFPWTNGKGGAR